jgi:hypothetical protein
MILEETKEATRRQGGIRGLNVADDPPPIRALLHQNQIHLQPVLRRGRKHIRDPGFQRQKLQAG